MDRLKIRRALFSATDKNGIVELARAMAATGTEIVATGRTASVLKEGGLDVLPIEKLSGSPEAFQGRMKTISFPVLSGILYRRGDSSDENDLKTLSIKPVDCVVVNFYPFEEAIKRSGITRRQLVEEIDIGGPTMVRAAAKNAPDVLVLTHPDQYAAVISELKASGSVSRKKSQECAAEAWDLILRYDQAIAGEFGARSAGLTGAGLSGLAGEAASALAGICTVGEPLGQVRRELRYGENPHQKAILEFDPNGPIAWPTEGNELTPTELSYNNILDLSAAYALASDLVALDRHATGVVIVKHNNPCGVALVSRNSTKDTMSPQMRALQLAWDGDPVSAFGGVLVFTDPIEAEAAKWLSERFVELVAAPGLSKEDGALRTMLSRRKNLKAVAIREFDGVPEWLQVTVPGGKLIQTSDTNRGEALKGVTRNPWPEKLEKVAEFGICVCRALKSNSIAIVREYSGALQLVGAGQGQPNRVEALQKLAIPRAKAVLEASGSGAKIGDCVMVSDAFFPFRDTVDCAHEGGIKYIVQPGGSIKDKDSIAACDEHGISMVFTGTRHFRH